VCGIAGAATLDASTVPVEKIVEALEAMRERGTEHGAGYAAYSPEPSGLVRARFFTTSPGDLEEAKRLLSPYRANGLRHYASLGHGVDVYEALLGDYPPPSLAGRLWFLQASRFLEVWKSIGWPREVAEAYRLWGRRSRAWIGHTRYPTNSPGFQPWLAHPFTSGETVIVHNGDLSSYGANRRFISYSLGLRGFTGNDSEVIAYLVEMLYRDGLGPADIVETLVYGRGPRWARLDGPYAVIYIHGDPRGPVFSAFVDRHHFRPLYVAQTETGVYVASEAAAVRAMAPGARPVMLRGGGYIVVYPDGEVEARGLTAWKQFSHPEPPAWAVDASRMSRRELNQALAEMLASRGRAAAYNLRGHRYVANGLGPGLVELWGTVGNASLNLVEGLEARIYGDAQEDLGDSMTGSRVIVYGNVGDSAGQAMRSGELHILGDAGNRLGVQMKGGTIVLRGDAGDYLAEFMAGGTIVVLGRVGRYTASGMVGGKIYIRGHLPVSHIGKAPPRRQVERYIRALADRGEITREQMLRALSGQTVGDLLEALGEKFRRLAKLWGVLHVGYPHAEYRYLRDEEREELEGILRRHVEVTKVPLDVEDVLNHKYTVITSVKVRPQDEGAW
jgi:glutamate synthase domain-containing protein 1/glutamate synthase domain-containing protein 3